MSTNRRAYTKEFKLEALRLLETSGKSQVQIERELGIGNGNLGRWRKELAEQGEVAFPGKGHQTPEQSELHRLRKENEILKQERDILKKAIAIFTEPKR